MSEEASETAVGFVTLTDDMYFTCSSGLTPAKIQATQTAVKTKDKHHYLINDSTGCPAIGDFMCRWTMVLAAAVAAVAASAALCGGLMASMRTWVGFSTLNSYGRKGVHSLTSKCQMLCPIGGIITYAPGITSQWQATVYTARNTTWALVEGAIIGKFSTLGLAAFAGKAMPSLTTALVNYGTLQVAARTVGVADQVVFEGMLRNGKRDFENEKKSNETISSLKEEAYSGLTMFEQPFYSIYDRANSGYYTGSYAKTAQGDFIPDAGNAKIGDVEILNHGTSALYTDLYYAGLSFVSMGMMAKGAATHENIAKEAIVAAKETIAKAGKAGKKFLFERGKLQKKGKSKIEIYEEIEILDDTGKPLGEFDGIDINKKTFIEDKSAKRLKKINPETGEPFSKPDIWARKQIFDKTSVRIENLKISESTRPKISDECPTIEEIKDFKTLEFRIEEKGFEALESAVQEELNNLKEKYPDWDFNAVYGN